MQIIGISGKRRSGKDSICDLLYPWLSSLNVGPWTRVAFADRVKEVLCRVTGVSREWIEKWKTKEEIPDGWDMNVRSALINIGDRFREIQTDIWIREVLRIKGNKLISDIRYPNEATKVSEQGIIIRVHREGTETLDNPSETSLSCFDEVLIREGVEGEVNVPDVPYRFFLRNEGTLQDLSAKLDTLVKPRLENSLKFFP